MVKRRTGVGIGLVMILLAVIVWRTRGGGDRASGAAGASGSSAGPTAAAAAGANRARRVDPRTQPRASIAGTVRDPAKAPIAGAQVCADLGSHELPPELTRDPACTTTDATGAYVLRELLAGTYRVGAGAKTYRPAEFHPDGDRHASTFELAPGQAKLGVDLVLRPGGVELTGVVSDISGGPVAHARVRAHAGRWGEGAPGPIVETDDTGAFSVWVKPGRLRVEASAEGYASASESAEAPGTVELLLTPESSLAGTVVDATTGAPVEGVHVKVSTSQWSWDEDGRALTDAEGKFRVARLTPGRYSATARTEHGYGRSEGSTLVGLGEHVDGVTVKLHHAARIVGTVVIPGSPAKPCLEAGVRFHDEEAERWIGSRTEPDGTVIADGVLPGTYKPTVWCAGYQGRESYAAIVVGDRDLVDQVWEVEAAGKIQGRVLATSGEVIEDAEISARTIGGAARAKQDWSGDTSAEDGTYELRGLVAATYRLSVDTDQGLPPEDGYRVEVAAGKTVTQDLIVEDGGTIQGTVVDDKGAPVAGVNVGAYPFASGRRWGGMDDAKSDRSGAFSIGPLHAGDYRVVARRGWGEQLRRPGANDDAKQGEKVRVQVAKTSTVKLVVESQTGTINGVVVDVGGAPVSDAYVSAARESDAAGAEGSSAHATRGWGWGGDKPQLTTTEGRFTIKDLSPGNYTVRAYRKGGGEAITEHVPVGATTRLQIKPTGSIAGTVTIAGGGAPDSIDVELADLKTGFSRDETYFRTGGAFAIHDLPAGHFHLTISAVGGRKQLELDLVEGQAKTGVTVELDALVTLTGRVVELGTQVPVAGFRMSAQLAQAGGYAFGWGNDDREHITDDAGRFTIKRAPRGQLSVVGMHKDFQDSDYGWLRALRVVDGTGTVDLGDLGVVKRRLKKGEIAGELGLHFKDLPPDTPPDKERLEVSYIDPAGPAARSGIEVGDVVTSIDGVDVTGGNSMNTLLLRAPPGTKLAIGLARGTTVTITLAPPS